MVIIVVIAILIISVGVIAVVTNRVIFVLMRGFNRIMQRQNTKLT